MIRWKSWKGGEGGGKPYQIKAVSSVTKLSTYNESLGLCMVPSRKG